MIEITAIPAFKDNYIWLLRHQHHAVVVDPGDAAPVLAALAAGGLSLSAILITHHHADHQGGVAALLARYPVPVYGPAAESITGCTHPLSGGETITLPGLAAAFTVLDVGGHTLGHVAYYHPGMLFCGDALFGLGSGKLFEGTPRQAAASLARISALPEDTQVYCAHEYTALNLPFAQFVAPENKALQARGKEILAARAAGLATVPFSLGLEKATNPFLRCDDPEVVASAQSQEPLAADAESVFAVLRAWRDVF